MSASEYICGMASDHEDYDYEAQLSHVDCCSTYSVTKSSKRLNNNAKRQGGFMGFKFNEEAAMSADKGGIIVDSGVYDVIITDAIVYAGNEKAYFAEFEFEADNGASAKYCRLVTHKKTGETAFGYNIVMALMGILGLSESTTAEETRDTKKVSVLKSIVGKKIKVGLQHEDYYNTSGALKYRMNIIHFFDPVSGCTFSEKKNNEPAKTITLKIMDKAAGEKPDQSSGTYNDVPHPAESDLPF